MPWRRFIPAWAGNALRRRLPDSPSHTVHPRVGGERHGRLRCRSRARRFIPAWAGNARSRPTGLAHAARFIPAWAGNAHAAIGDLPSRHAVHPRVGGERRARRGTSARQRAVHPRVGGERVGTDAGDLERTDGSSPRGRGTHAPASWTSPIPVHPRVGGERHWRNGAAVAAVHPRVGGERRSAVDGVSGRVGSSPRGRGTPGRRSRCARAEAGSSPRGRGTRRRRAVDIARHPVHPRVGGERRSMPPGRPASTGPSPRGRGTPCRDLRRLDTRRGSSPRGRGTPIALHRLRRRECGSSPRGRGTPADDWPWVSATSVHPRVGGERHGRSPAPRSTSGSSPRGRGTPMPRLRHCAPRSGSSPRGRGTPRRRRHATCDRAVHPRVGGERAADRGSRCDLDRFIPAWAGNAGEHDPPREPQRGSSPRGRGTLDADRCHDARHPVHPRVGGERRHGDSSAHRRCGSSPRGRGTRRRHRSRRDCTAVHPRVGGERMALALDCPGACCGSSPRGRGTLSVGPCTAVARDGSSPRGRGTPVRVRGPGLATAGSSPRGRGTPACASSSWRRRCRFIPAWAGNALPRDYCYESAISSSCSPPVF